MTKTEKIKQGVVDIGQPHLLISYSPNLGCDGWVPVAVLSAARSVAEIRFALLGDNIHEDILKKVNSELAFYLYEKHEIDPVAYLFHYHVCQMANIYSHVHFTAINGISSGNIIYYLNTMAKLARIHNNAKLRELQKQYVQLAIDVLFEKALDREKRLDHFDFNRKLSSLYNIIFNIIPQRQYFEMSGILTIVEFSTFLAKMKINDFCNILNYLKHDKLIKNNEIGKLLQVYCMNQNMHKKINKRFAPEG